MQYRIPILAELARSAPDLLERARAKATVDLSLWRPADTPERAVMEGMLAGRAAAVEGLGEPAFSAAQMKAEAIVLTIVRPPMLIRNGTYLEPDPSRTLPEVLTQIRAFNRARIDPAIAISGRVELVDVPGMPYLGTGWVIDKRGDDAAIVVTNRHVASIFAVASTGGYRFRTLPNYRPYEVKLDFMEEHEQTAPQREAPVVKVLYIAADAGPDIALLEVKGEVVRTVQPIAASARAAAANTPIGVVGYPAYDSRADIGDMQAYFGAVYNVKRFAFGAVTGLAADARQFTHDATTLGGNSGSVVFNREDGGIVGLHFAGNARIANYAVTIAEVQAAVRGLTSQVVVPSRIQEAIADGTTPAASFAGRDGYSPVFLGRSQELKLPPPRPGPWEGDLTLVGGGDAGAAVSELKYRHFSVWMSASRRLPLITAVNIDGKKAKRLGRTDKWKLDGRIAGSQQLGNEIYRNNALDRGHMVRREDPVWGSRDIAEEANLDTFHYTNSAPQHEDLNQKDWLALEDYVLGNAKTRGLKVSVFTGPVLRQDDPEYRGEVKVPRAFWKIVGIVNDDTGKLSVTGYLLTQDDLIHDLGREFVYGAFRTYQVEVARIGELTGLNVSHLTTHDPMARARREEGAAGVRHAFRTIGGSADLLL